MRRYQIFSPVLAILLCATVGWAEEVSSSVDLTKFVPDNTQPAPPVKKKAPSVPSALPSAYVYSRFAKRFPLELDTREKLEAAADKFAMELATEYSYRNTCGLASRNEAKKDKNCDVAARICRISVASEKCHYVEYYARCPDGSIAPFSPGHENRGFKVCMKIESTRPPGSGGFDGSGSGARPRNGYR